MAVKAKAGPDRSSRTRSAGLFCAVVVVIMLVAQLYNYQDMPMVLAGILSVYDHFILLILAAGVVLIELLALPYLLNMYISPLMRVVSAGCAVIVSAFWLLSALTNAHAANAGLFSTTLDVPGGLIPVSWSLVLAGLLAAVISSDSKFTHDRAS